MIPVAGIAHSLVAAQLAVLLDAPARANGLLVGAEFNLGSKENYRVPDLGVHRDPQLAVWVPTAAIAVEILSPDDDTWKKLPFYAQHEVDELLIVDPADRSVTWLALREGEYRPIERQRDPRPGRGRARRAYRLAARVELAGTPPVASSTGPIGPPMLRSPHRIEMSELSPTMKR